MKLSTITSRTVLAVTLAFANATVALAPAYAAAPMQQKQVPGFYRTMIGDYEVTAIYDGGGGIDSSLLRGDPALIQSLLAHSFQNDPKNVTASVQGYLVNTGSKLVLIDTGAGGHWGGPTLGKLVQNLKASGYSPEQVDLVLLTHLHADHVGGIYDGGKRVFPNATVMMKQADADFWLSKEIMAKAPEEAKIFFAVAQDAAAPYISASKWAPYQGMDEILPGIAPYEIPGHTPGHTGYMISSQGQSLLIWGDVAHVMAVQMPHPEIGIVFDSDSAAAIKTREDLLIKLASDKTMIAAAHMPFPGLGRVRKIDTGAGYDWVPTTFVNLKGVKP
ncbi:MULTISPECIES: MBL fold metallo-hydrolase [unclassified Rhizobium]|uniref:MBL fold metallo-hydrolase n=1 Tax=unclassified Rhizobium TaxID=2613769 RepID=UPI000BD93EEF|nr:MULTISPECIES: MBL fold metallo-hydrolase [unclassified Rhizobium]MDH7809487.1 glyoxylase-like metal-dependent hydrolase (beta-lactamase superfamily II) [Rhizobium sp. AN67]MDQ4408737.1 MBL fold metallo-hydrolase [Rhizobium sp. AN63]SOD50387.1 Glyoxylase, beta-lactamase superfamily II [Rhizobium sp. AN6A]